MTPRIVWCSTFSVVNRFCKTSEMNIWLREEISKPLLTTICVHCLVIRTRFPLLSWYPVSLSLCEKKRRERSVRVWVQWQYNLILYLRIPNFNLSNIKSTLEVSHRNWPLRVIRRKNWPLCNCIFRTIQNRNTHNGYGIGFGNLCYRSIFQIGNHIPDRSFSTGPFIFQYLNSVTERKYLPTNFEANHIGIAYHLLIYLYDLVFFLARDKSGGKRPLCCQLDVALSLVFGLIPCEIDLCGSTTFSGTGRMSRTRR